MVNVLAKIDMSVCFFFFVRKGYENRQHLYRNFYCIIIVQPQKSPNGIIVNNKLIPIL